MGLRDRTHRGLRFLSFALSLALTWSASCELVLAQTAALVPNASQQFFNAQGQPLANGSVYFFVPNTTTPKTVWSDQNQTNAFSQPVTLDAGGFPQNGGSSNVGVFGQGNYREQVFDANSNLIFDGFTSAYGSASPSGATGTDTAPVGTVIPFSGFTVPVNWQLAYGQALSRTTFAQLLAALTISTATGNCSATSTTVSGFTSTAQIPVGSPIESTCLPTSTTVASIVNATTITVSNAATATGTYTITDFPWGNGDGVTTFNVPDLRGRVIAGPDAMGGTAASRLTSSFYGANAGPPGVAGGLQDRSFTLSQANLPNVNFPVSGITLFNGTAAATANVGLSGGSPATSFVVSNTNLSDNFTVTSPSGTNLQITSNVTVATQGNAASGGSATPTTITTIQPTITANYIIKVAANTSGAGGVTSLGGMFGDIVCDSTFLCTPEGSPAVNTIGLATQGAGTILANVNNSAAQPVGVAPSAVLDNLCGNTLQGNVLYRGVTNWSCLPPGTNGFVLTTAGSGANPSWSAGTSGAITANVTTTSGFTTGQILYSDGSQVQALPTGAAGTILEGQGSSAPAYTAAPVLGVNGSVFGTLGLANATSGGATVTIENTGATSPYTFILPTTEGSTGNILASGGGAAMMTWDTTTGSGTTVALATSPTLVTPTLGAALATSINGLAITSTTGTLTIASAKTLAINNSLGFSGTDGATFTFPGTSDTVATLGATQTLSNKTLTTPTINGGALSGTFSGAPTLSGANFVSYANIAQLGASSLLGNPTGSLANMEAITLDSTLGFSGTTLKCTTATSLQLGCVKPDGTIITVSSGAITVAKATNAAYGAMEGDGSTLSCTAGVCSAVGGTATTIDAGGATTTVNNGATGDLLQITGTSPLYVNKATIASLLTAGAGISVTGTTNATIALALTNATLNANPAQETTTSTSAVMAGLGGTCKITPVYSGRVKLVITGSGANNTAGDALDIAGLYYGTGSAPSNGAAITGTNLNTNVEGLGGGAGNTNVPFGFARSGIATGLAVGTQIWFDMAINSVVGGTATINGLQCNAQEF